VTPTGVVPRCPGDCDESHDVAVDEIVIAVTIALGTSPVEACPAADVDGVGGVTVDEIVQAVNAALGGALAGR